MLSNLFYNIGKDSILFISFSFLSAKDLSTISTTNKAFAMLSNDDYLWKVLCEASNYKNLKQKTRSRTSNLSFKEVYVSNICVECRNLDDEKNEKNDRVHSVGQIILNLAGGMRNSKFDTCLIPICARCYERVAKVPLSARLKSPQLLLPHARKILSDYAFTTLIQKIIDRKKGKKKATLTFKSNRKDIEDPGSNNYLLKKVRIKIIRNE